MADDDLNLAASRLSEVMREVAFSVQEFGEAMSSLGEAIMCPSIESLYLEEHDRLPGSDRTRRLRKKRRTRLLEWYWRG